MTDQPNQRLPYIDCMRGLACLLMFEVHCYDSWLNESVRSSAVMRWSYLLATLAAPSFLFMVGVSLTLAMESMERRGMPQRAIARTIMRRGIIILLLALLFRVQEFALGWPYAPWTDLLRVDILNVIGVSIALIGVIVFARDRSRRGIAAGAIALAIAIITPLLWTSWRPRWLPWFLESYVNGVHTFSEPQPWLFPMFPWMAFCFAGLAVGALLRSEWAQRALDRTMALVAIGSVGLAGIAFVFDALPVRLYSVYDFWHTSPNFFFVRVGIVLLILAGCYVWSLYSAQGWVMDRMVQLGQSSLLVYWAHIEFVYGRFSILPKRGASIPEATVGFLVIVAAMMLLASARVWLHTQRMQILNRFRGKPLPAREYQENR